MESVFEISFRAKDCKVKFATCTLVDATLTWWNSYVKITGVSNANAMSWRKLKQLMIKKYCPCEVMQKLEQAL